MTSTEVCTAPADFGRTLRERLRRDPVPGLQIPPTDDPPEDYLALESNSCRFDVEWYLHPDRPSHVDVFVEHRSDPALLADWLARNLSRVNSETDSELDDYAVPGATYACPTRWAESWSPQAGAEIIDWIVRCLNAFSTVPAIHPTPLPPCSLRADAAQPPPAADPSTLSPPSTH